MQRRCGHIAVDVLSAPDRRRPTVRRIGEGGRACVNNAGSSEPVRSRKFINEGSPRIVKCYYKTSGACKCDAKSVVLPLVCHGFSESPRLLPQRNALLRTVNVLRLESDLNHKFSQFGPLERAPT